MVRDVQSTSISKESAMTINAISASVSFPLKIHFLLEKAEKTGQSDVVAWLPSGKSFQVFQKDKFVKIFMPGFFTTSSYKSFQRNLQLWGFKAVNKGPERGSYAHPLFVRGGEDLCKSMKRAKKKQAERPSSPIKSLRPLDTGATQQKGKSMLIGIPQREEAALRDKLSLSETVARRSAGSISLQGVREPLPFEQLLSKSALMQQASLLNNSRRLEELVLLQQLSANLGAIPASAPFGLQAAAGTTPHSDAIYRALLQREALERALLIASSPLSMPAENRGPR